MTSAFLILLFAIPAYADQLIIEPDMGRAPILNFIKGSNHSLNLVMYGFTDETLLQALIKQKNNGKTIKIILEENPYKAQNQNRKVIQKLNDQQISWRGSNPSFRLIHQKTLISDNKKALVMTFNFTRSAFKNDRNFGLIIDDPKRVQEISNIFSADWNRNTTSHASSYFIVSPDNSRKELLKFINKANSNINIYAQSISDFKIVGALAKAAKKGVRVKILTSNNIRDQQKNYLTRAGVILQKSKNHYIHAKVIMIDNKVAILGSINLTRASLDDNRELSVVINDAYIIKQLENIFDKDWGSAEWKAPNQKTFLKMFRRLEKFINQL